MLFSEGMVRAESVRSKSEDPPDDRRQENETEKHAKRSHNWEIWVKYSESIAQAHPREWWRTRETKPQLGDLGRVYGLYREDDRGNAGERV
jgi:hypothetical protein